MEITPKSAHLIEMDSLENVLQLVSKGAATALLPSYLQKDGYVSTDNRIFQIDYYSYQYKL